MKSTLWYIYDKRLKVRVTKPTTMEKLKANSCYYHCIPDLKKDSKETIKNKEARYELREAK